MFVVSFAYNQSPGVISSSRERTLIRLTIHVATIDSIDPENTPSRIIWNTTYIGSGSIFLSIMTCSAWATDRASWPGRDA